MYISSIHYDATFKFHGSEIIPAYILSPEKCHLEMTMTLNMTFIVCEWCHLYSMVCTFCTQTKSWRIKGHLNYTYPLYMTLNWTAWPWSDFNTNWLWVERDLLWQCHQYFLCRVLSHWGPEPGRSLRHCVCYRTVWPFDLCPPSRQWPFLLDTHSQPVKYNKQHTKSTTWHKTLKNIILFKNKNTVCL